MRLKHYSSIFMLVAISIFFACNGAQNADNNSDIDSNKKVVNNQVQIQLKIETLPDAKQEFMLGENPKISVKQIDTSSFDSIVFSFANEYVKTVTELPLELEVINTNEKPGRMDFEARIFKNNNYNNQKLTIKFLSDITPKEYTYEVVKTYPHDRKAFTQGLVFENGFFYEATGIKGESSIRKVQIGTGDVIQSFTIDPNIFGEGITIFGDKIIQLSWQDHVGFVYNKKTFELLAKFNYPTDGWGLTNDGKHLIMSDGTNKLFFLDSETYTEVDRVEVYDNKGPVDQLNELEYINGDLYANIYQTDKIVKIDPKTGKVLAYIDLKGILPKNDYDRDTDVLNGIAYDFNGKKLFVTGKRWPKLFEIKLIEK